MKTLYLALLNLLLLLPAAARAQETVPALREQATAATRTLAAFVSLDDARQLPVRRLVQLRLSQEAEVRTQYADDPAMLQNKLTAIGREYTTQLSTTLSPAQFERLLAAAPNTLPATVAIVRQPGPTTSPVAVPATAPTVEKAPVARRPATAPARPATATSRTKAPVRPATPIIGTIRH
ncbi:hypothetical protein [Hymenobacter psychrophilus]|uniref:LTXXQ motif family protein n=1 Tax=Hymenobacter psychrophilus TaxID=651662 RepID=A0A1H3M9K4_9BACT|nr:hypothetical protein [Hymenobacter psychrophilus]SDY73400.1 hypothetical protein SAMN04488069_112110 [Hymenobacter psychrophilus]